MHASDTDRSVARACQAADAVRFAGDVAMAGIAGPRPAEDRLRAMLYENGVALSEALTPDLHAGFRRVCDRLLLPDGAATGFVYASPEIQAGCYSTDDGCHVSFSSGLIGLLSGDEFAFVVGHELGHFLLGHHRLLQTRDQTPEFFMRSRSQEISVDRIGLLACGSLEVGLHALMKTVSGLSAPHLRFDVGAFIGQIRRLSSDGGIGRAGATHPPILIRSRALLWFSMSEACRNWPAPSQSALEQIDARVERDLNRFVDGTVKRDLEELRRTVLLWAVAARIVAAGSFGKAVQARLRQRFDEETVESLRTFFSHTPPHELAAAVRERFAAAVEALDTLAPRSRQHLLEAVERDADAFVAAGP